MVVGVIFEFGGDIVEVRIQEKNVFFRTSQSQQWTTIDGLKLSKDGVFKEFPELKENKDWELIAKENFKDKIKKMKTEKERIIYVIEDLSKHGYKAKYYQKDGFRTVKL